LVILVASNVLKNIPNIALIPTIQPIQNQTDKELLEYEKNKTKT
jgi:hypothetical protein